VKTKYDNLAALVAKDSDRVPFSSELEAPEQPLPPLNASAAPLPTPSEVLYVRPNSDGTRKACANCYAYASTQRRCYIHDPNLDVAPDAVCGYHVFSRKVLAVFDPSDRLPMDYVTPAESGLERVPGGSSCDLCRFYEPVDLENGLCYAVADFEGSTEPTSVQPLGCCARWTAK